MAGGARQGGNGLLSERARLQWDTYVAARKAHATPFGDRDELHRFLIGIHLRREQLTAPELRDLLAGATDEAAERDALGTFVEDGLALLASYERLTAADEEAYVDGAQGGFQV